MCGVWLWYGPVETDRRAGQRANAASTFLGVRRGGRCPASAAADGRHQIDAGSRHRSGDAISQDVRPLRLFALWPKALRRLVLQDAPVWSVHWRRRDAVDPRRPHAAHISRAVPARRRAAHCARHSRSGGAAHALQGGGHWPLQRPLLPGHDEFGPGQRLSALPSLARAEQELDV